MNKLKAAINEVKSANSFVDTIGANNVHYLSASYNGLLYVLVGVMFSYLANDIFKYVDRKWIDNQSQNKDVPTWKLAIEFGFQTFVIIMMVILIKNIVPKIPSPFGAWRKLLGLDRDVTTGTVLLAFSVLMYMDEYKRKLKLFVERLRHLLD